MGENICKSSSNKGVIYIHNSYNSIIKQTTQFKNEQMDLNRHFSKNDIQVAKKHITSYQGNANQTHNETTSYPLGWISSKSQTLTSGSEDVEKSNPHTLLMGMKNSAVAMKNSLMVLWKFYTVTR